MVIDEIVKIHGVPESIVSDREPHFTFKLWVFWETFSLEWCGSLWESREVSPRFVRPYPILVSVGPVAYRLVVPSVLARVFIVFHVSMLASISGISHIFCILGNLSPCGVI